MCHPSPRVAVLLVLIFLLSMTTSVAQQDAPLIVYANGDLLIGDENGVQVFSECTPDEVIMMPLTMLPDGRGFILMTEPPRVTQVIRELGGVGGAVLPNNLYYCDLRARTLTLIQGQPDDFAFFDESALDNGIAHSLISASPDGGRIAWSQIRFPDYQSSLHTYDLTTGQSHALEVTLFDSFGVPVPPLVLWLERGVGIVFYTFDETTFDALTLFEYYALTPEGAFVQDAPLLLELNREGELSDFIDTFLSVQYEGKTWLALRYNLGGWALVEAQAGDVIYPQGLPYIVATQNADESLRLVYDMTPNYEINWQAQGISGRDFFNYNQNRIALSGDGLRVAFAGGVLEVWHSADGRVVPVPNTDGFADDFSATVLWGGTTWRWDADATAIMSAQTVCQGAQPSRMMPNTLGRIVAPNIPNNVRSAPSTSAELVGQIPGGATFTVLSLPTCADGYAWYQIQYGELVGWTAEGTSDTYWLEPLNE